MLMALILICSARTVMRVPAEFSNPITCFTNAQAYVAETSFGQDLDGKDLIRIICVRRHEASATR